MLRITVEVVINRPIHEVGDFFADLRNTAQWAVGVSDVQGENPPRVGASVSWKQTFLGKQEAWTMVITEFAPDQTLAMKSVISSFPIMYRYTFAPVERGTRVTAYAESEPGGFYKLAEPLVAAVAKRQLHASLENLKDLLEAAAPVPA
jgi:uncharacterized membrane protein